MEYKRMEYKSMEYKDSALLKVGSFSAAIHRRIILVSLGNSTLKVESEIPWFFLTPVNTNVVAVPPVSRTVYLTGSQPDCSTHRVSF